MKVLIRANACWGGGGGAGRKRETERDVQKGQIRSRKRSFFFFSILTEHLAPSQSTFGAENSQKQYSRQMLFTRCLGIFSALSQFTHDAKYQCSVRRKSRDLEAMNVFHTYCCLCFILPHSTGFLVTSFGGSNDQSPPHSTSIKTPLKLHSAAFWTVLAGKVLTVAWSISAWIQINQITFFKGHMSVL